MTTAEILQLMRLKLLEAGTEIVEDSTLLLYANLAFKDVIKKAFPNSSILTATVAFTSGVGSLPASFGTLYSDAMDTNGNVYPELSISDFARNLNDGTNGIVFEGGQLKVSPSSTASLSVKYYPTYLTLTEAVNPTIDEYLHEPIVYGGLERAFEDLQDPEMSVFYATKYKNMLTDKINTLSNYEEDAQRGGVMFNGLNIIGGGINNDPTRW